MNFKHYSKNKLGPGTKLMTAVHSQSGIREVKIHAPFFKNNNLYAGGLFYT